MLLRIWMYENRWSDRRFAEKISEILRRNNMPEVTSRSVANWRHGLSVPRRQVIEAIEEFTEGKVVYADHAAAVKGKRGDAETDTDERS